MDSKMASRNKYQLLQQFNDAHSKGKLAIGIKAVYNAATHRRALLLLIEEEHSFASREVLDDVMEKVVKSGGDVEFVEPGMLTAYEHIVLIE